MTAAAEPSGPATGPSGPGSAGSTGRHPRRLLAGALAVLSAAAGWLALRPEPAPAVMATAARPLWTPDRLPALLAEASGAVGLAAAVDGALAEVPSSCLVAFEGNRPVVSRRPEAAGPDPGVDPEGADRRRGHLRARRRLHLLHPGRGRRGPAGRGRRARLAGGGRRSATGHPRVRALPGRSARSAGRLPTSLDRLAEGLVEAGVRSVTAGIAGDDSRYDRARIVPTWKPNYVTDNEVGPLGALLVNSGFTDFVPPEARAVEPAVHAAAELARLASGRGVAVGPAITTGTPPPGAVTLAEVRSVPLRDVVASMVTESDNTAAELLVRELGRVATGDGSTPAGVGAVAAELTELGLPVDGLKLGDGSGLEATNTVTCALLASTLGTVEGARGWLAVAGRSGTLARRLLDTPLEGHLAAKTGQIKGVTGLTGFVDGRRRLRFAFLANGTFDPAAGRALGDRLATLLANYPAPPGAG